MRLTWLLKAKRRERREIGLAKRRERERGNRTRATAKLLSALLPPLSQRRLGASAASFNTGICFFFFFFFFPLKKILCGFKIKERMKGIKKNTRIERCGETIKALPGQGQGEALRWLWVYRLSLSLSSLPNLPLFCLFSTGFGWLILFLKVTWVSHAHFVNVLMLDWGCVCFDVKYFSGVKYFQVKIFFGKWK